MTMSWRVPDVGFSQVQIAAARRVVMAVAARDGEPELAVLGGDRAVGLGNVDAAVELYLVNDAPGRQEARHDVDGTAIRVHTLPGAVVADQLGLGRAYRATSVRSPQLVIPAEQVGGLVRLLTGHRLVVAPKWAAELDAVDEDAVRRLVVSRCALAFASAAEDTFEALLSGDLFTAVAGSSSALLSGSEAALAATGDLECGGRHLFRRLARTAPTAPWCAYLWRLLNGAFRPDAVPSAAEVRTVVEERLLAANLLLSFSVLEGWDKRLAWLPEPGAVAAPGCCAGPRRSAFFTPVHFSDALTLLGPRQGYQITESVLRLWRRLDGRSRERLAQDLVGSEPMVAGLPLPDLDAAMTVLHEVGAAGFAATRPPRASVGGPEARYPEFSSGAARLAISPSTRFTSGPRPAWARGGLG
jgi:hypothetical protein